jgi:ectoine hydroxylase-related dioxygenase (phytanoyl-CoA dioxygenase family)
MTPSDEQVSCFREKGYVCLGEVFSVEEVAAWDAESRRLLRLGLAHGDNLRAVSYLSSTGLRVVDRLGPVIDISPLFGALARDERILEALRSLYGHEMLLFKDKIIYKMLGVPGYGLHQDYSLWQRFPRDLANVIVSIDGADAFNGGVEFFPGYHERLLSTPGELRYLNEEEARQIYFEKGETPATEPGDVIVFDCLTPHRSGINRSNRLRRQLYLTYSSAHNGDLYEKQLRFLEEQGRAKRGAAARNLFFR